MVNLSEPFIRRPVMTTLIMVAIIIFGLYAYRSLPVSDLPNIDYPTITVTAQQPGASPEYQANLVARPLERNFAEISGLMAMTSKNTMGNSVIVLNFDLDVNLDAKEVEVQQAVAQSIPDLPPLPNSPTYERQNPADAPILYLALSSNSQTLAGLYETGYNLLAQPISMINGVSQVDVYGYPYAARVQADPMKLMAYNIDFNELAAALIDSNPNLPSGSIQGYYENVLLQTEGQIAVGEEYDEVVIKEDKGLPLFVGNLARGRSALESRNPYFHLVDHKGKKSDAVTLAVSRLPGSNTIKISKDIKKLLPTLKKGIPGSLNLEIFYDKSVEIISTIKDVQLTLVVALILVIAVIFLYLGKILETIIPSLVLPLSILATFVVMHFLGFNLDNLSLLALILAIGFIVDDSIVVMENIVRHVEMGKRPFVAALDGSKQISVTVFTMSLALSAVFIPFIWLPGILGRIFNEFALTIVIAIFCSGFISLTLNPMLCSRYIVPHKFSDKLNLSERVNAKMLGWYEWALHHSIYFRKTTLFCGIACIFLTVWIAYLLPYDFIPTGNLSLIQGMTVCQEGSSTLNTINHQLKMNEILERSPYQNGFMTMAGWKSSSEGRFFLRLIEPQKRPTSTEIAHSLYQQSQKIVGMDAFLRPFPLINLQVGAGSGLGEYQYTLMSTDLKTLHDTATIVTDKMKALPEFTGVNSDMSIQSPQLDIKINRDVAGLYNISASEIESTLQYAYSGGRIGTFNKGLNLYDLILEAEPGFDLTTEDIDLLYIKAENVIDDKSVTNMVPLKSVASWKEIAGPASLNHYNTFPSVTISFNLASGVALGTALDKIDQIAKDSLPENVVGTLEGAAKVFRETLGAMRWLFIIALLAIYLLLGILYESFIHPLTILSALPVALFGGLLTLWVFGLPLSLYSAVGMIVLMGLVQKNGIMLIDFALEYLHEPGDASPLQAIFEASKERFRPILMTTIAAMVGALPIAIGIGEYADQNRPLGLVIIGGLLFSQLITLFVTPVVFLYMQDFHNFLARRKAEKKRNASGNQG
ncbi:MAG: efflux RND transporter permease subunit [Chlamydiales bacterium]|nr:efflux RND transporter permease subunit [Chlamydiales bacterium]